MSVSFKLKPLALAMMPILFAGTTNLAYAAEEDKTSAEDDETEVVEVTGYRGSVIKSINDKKFSKNIVDSIFSEDVGKSTDQNIADALSRVTGVSIQETDGEGTKISVRGAGADFNNISLNGVTLTSSDPNQGIDLSSFSADVLSQISVYKTSSADHDEGSLGANVILRSAKPLNLKKDRLQFEVQGKYNQFADEYDSKVTGAFSKKFFDDTVGFIITAVNETNAVRRDSISGNWLDPYQSTYNGKPDNYGDFAGNIIKAGQARDHLGNVTTQDMHAIVQKSLTYNLNQNQRDRFNLAAGLQFQPFDTTDIQLNLNYSKQTVANDNHKVTVNAPDIWSDATLINHEPGAWGNLKDPKYPEADDRSNVRDPITNEYLLAHPNGDNQKDLYTINTDTRTLTKSLWRYGGGSLGRRTSEEETINKVLTLTLEQEITDNFRLDFRAGYSNTEYDTLFDYNVNTAQWNTLGNTVKRNIPEEDLEPIGFDCTSGKCQMVVGTTPYVLAGVDNIRQNLVQTPFNPLDEYSHHVGYTNITDAFTSDTNKSIFLDFDWDVDTLGITQVEFGAKWSERVKEVYRNDGRFQGDERTAFDPVTGRPVTGRNPDSITTAEITDTGAWPVDDWLQGIVAKDGKYSTDFLNGWGLINAEKAFFQIFSLDDVELQFDQQDRRETVQDNYSYYGKLNFEYFDGRLTGDVGTRYVRTKVESPVGFASLNYFRTDRIFAPHEMRAAGLWEQSNPTCTAMTNQNRTIRIDGTYKLGLDEDGNPMTFTDRDGVTYTGTADGVTIPREYPCYDPEVAVADYVDPDSGLTVNGHVGPDTPVTGGGRIWWSMMRHNDESTLGDKSQRLFKTTGNGANDIWLPSLNLNYQLSDEWIGRFAVSKTMSRPGFDNLRPGFTFNEAPWSDSSRMSLPDPQLQPLKSKNLDLSLEWYFNESGQLSLAYFRKDMTDFLESVKEFVYVKDMRHDSETQKLEQADFIFPVDESWQAGEPLRGADGEIVLDAAGKEIYCHPDRVPQDLMTGVLNMGCDSVQATIQRNGSGAITDGFEFTYRQTYDFLPGAWSGLGMNFNYTLAKSDTDAEVLELSGKPLKSLPQPYTPKHTANTSLYWEKYGHQIRLTHRYTSIQLARRGLTYGAEWRDARSVVDLAANYKVNDNVTITFNALNLTNSETRTFFTSTNMFLGDYEQNDAGDYLDLNGDVISVTKSVETLNDGSQVTETMPATWDQITSSSALWDKLVDKPFDEGNPMEDSSVTTSRTMDAYKTGRQYRLGIRVNF